MVIKISQQVKVEWWWRDLPLMINIIMDYDKEITPNKINIGAEEPNENILDVTIPEEPINEEEPIPITMETDEERNLKRVRYTDSDIWMD